MCPTPVAVQVSFTSWDIADLYPSINVSDKNEFDFNWHKSIDTDRLIESINERLFARIDVKNRKGI